MWYKNSLVFGFFHSNVEYYEFLSEVCLASRCIYLWPRGNNEDLSSWYPQVVTIIYFKYKVKYYNILQCDSYNYRN